MTTFTVAVLMGTMLIGGLFVGFWVGRDYELKKWMAREDTFFAALLKYRLSTFDEEAK